MTKIRAMVADGLEEVECFAVVDVLLRQGYDVKMVSVMGREEIVGTHGIRFKADELFDAEALADADLIFLPGGMPGTTNLGDHEGLRAVLKAFNEDPEKRLAAICAAPMVFGQLGFLDGKEATCFPGCEGPLEKAKLSTQYVVTDGRITTARGMGVALELGLEIIRLFDGDQAAAKMRADIQMH